MAPACAPVRVVVQERRACRVTDQGKPSRYGSFSRPGRPGAAIACPPTISLNPESEQTRAEFSSRPSSVLGRSRCRRSPGDRTLGAPQRRAVLLAARRRDPLERGVVPRSPRRLKHRLRGRNGSGVGRRQVAWLESTRTRQARFLRPEVCPITGAAGEAPNEGTGED